MAVPAVASCPAPGSPARPCHAGRRMAPVEQDALAVREQLFHERVRECIVSVRGRRGGGSVWRGEVGGWLGAHSLPWDHRDRTAVAAPHPMLIGARAAATACARQISGCQGWTLLSPFRDPSAGSSSPSCGLIVLRGLEVLWWCQSRASPMPGSWLCPCPQISRTLQSP